MHLTFSIQAELVIPYVRGMAQSVSGVNGKAAMGGGLRRELIDHLNAMPPNKRFPEATTGFYKEAAQAVSSPKVDNDGVTVSITKLGLRQRLLGGFIRQNTPGKTYLTIPAQSFAYGRLAREFTGLKFTFARNEEGYLMPALVSSSEGASVSGMKKPRRKKGQPAKPPIGPDQVVFWLVTKVYQEADPSVLPTQAEMEEACREGLVELIRSRLRDPDAEVTFMEAN